MKIIVNCAMTADGKLATHERRQLAISGERDLRRVHELRSQVDAILVGVGTILADDPRLTVKERYVPGAKNPLRVVLDSRGRTPRDARVLDGDASTLIYTLGRGEHVDGGEHAPDGAEDIPGATVVRLEGKNRVPVKMVVDDLAARRIETLLVEGGGETIWSFFDDGLVDEYHVFIGSQIVGGRSAPTSVDGEGREAAESIGLELVSLERLEEGVLLSYRVSK